ncbi:unnamed protein product [Gongylonema pulchrum]|uniref:Uncharacterized protein n=1 Tax=Gongylonema pulchrum TaxID=637853 RepID=A0A3P7MR51_9BILA|nr:unnamed protein product [Gongylonema pulchrum]
MAFLFFFAAQKSQLQAAKVLESIKRQRASDAVEKGGEQEFANCIVESGKTAMEMLELKAKARLKAKLKSDKELGLIRRDGERHSVPRTSKGTSRFPRHLSLEITQGDVRRPSASIPSSPAKDNESAVKEGAAVYAVQSLPPTPPNRGLLARIFGSENTKSERPAADESSNKIGCFGGKAEDDDGFSDLHAVNIEDQKGAGLLGRFSSFRKLRTRKGSSDLDNRSIDNDAADSKTQGETLNFVPSRNAKF